MSEIIISLAAGALGGFFFQVFIFRPLLRRARAKAEVQSNACVHDWANWTSPEEREIAVYNPYASFYGNEGSPRLSTAMQIRICLKCNLQERRAV